MGGSASAPSGAGDATGAPADKDATVARLLALAGPTYASSSPAALVTLDCSNGTLMLLSTDSTVEQEITTALRAMGFRLRPMTAARGHGWQAQKPEGVQGLLGFSGAFAAALTVTGTVTAAHGMVPISYLETYNQGGGVAFYRPPRANDALGPAAGGGAAAPSVATAGAVGATPPYAGGV